MEKCLEMLPLASEDSGTCLAHSLICSISCVSRHGTILQTRNLLHLREALKTDVSKF